MKPDERVYSLSKISTGQVLDTLMDHVEECAQNEDDLGPLGMLTQPTAEEQTRYLNNKAVFEEWNELLDEDSEGCGEDYLGDGVPWWVAKFYLTHLYQKKAATNFWKNNDRSK